MAHKPKERHGMAWHGAALCENRVKTACNGLNENKFGWNVRSALCHLLLSLLFIPLIFMPIVLSGSERKDDAAAAAKVTYQQDTFKLHQHHPIITVTIPIVATHGSLWINRNCEHPRESHFLHSTEFTELIISFVILYKGFPQAFSTQITTLDRYFHFFFLLFIHFLKKYQVFTYSFPN